MDLLVQSLVQSSTRPLAHLNKIDLSLITNLRFNPVRVTTQKKCITGDWSQYLDQSRVPKLSTGRLLPLKIVYLIDFDYINLRMGSVNTKPMRHTRSLPLHNSTGLRPKTGYWGTGAGPRLHYHSQKVYKTPCGNSDRSGLCRRHLPAI